MVIGGAIELLVERKEDVSKRGRACDSGGARRTRPILGP